MIKRLTASNVKVAAIDHELKPVNIFTGDNATGKTARLDAIAIGLYGRHPDLGATAGDTFTLSCGPAMEVRLQTAGFGLLRREWKRGKAGVKRTCEPDAKEWPELPEVMLHPKAYLDLSERERVRYIARVFRAGRTERTVQDIVKTIADLPLESPNKLNVAALSEAAQKLKESIDESKSVPDWLDMQVIQCREDVKIARATVDRLRKSAEASAQLEAQSGFMRATRNVDGELKAASEKVGALRAKLADMLKAKGDALTAEKRTEMTDAADKLKAVIARREELVAKRDALAAIEYTSETADLIEQRDKVRRELNDVVLHEQSHKATVKKLEKAIADDLGARCQCCGNTGEECPGAARRLTVAKDQLQDVSSKVQALTAQAEAKTAALNEAGERLAKSKAADEEHYKRQDEIRQIGGMLEETALAQIQLEKLRTRYATAQAIQAPSAEELATAQRELDDAVLAVEGLTAMQKAHAAAQGHEARKIQVQEQLGEAEAIVEVLKLVCAKLDEIQAEIVADIFGGLLALVNRLCAGILRTPIAYHEGELGRWDGPFWIPHSCFSGTEKALAYAAVGAALAQDSPIKIVMVDEMARLTPANRRTLVRAMLTLTAAGVIDQFVGVDLDSSSYAEIESDSFQVVVV